MRRSDRLTREKERRGSRGNAPHNEFDNLTSDGDFKLLRDFGRSRFVKVELTVRKLRLSPLFDQSLRGSLPRTESSSVRLSSCLV